jgi:hypothetical protein
MSSCEVRKMLILFALRTLCEVGEKGTSARLVSTPASRRFREVKSRSEEKFWNGV